MSDPLTLDMLYRIEQRAKAWGGAFRLDDDEAKKIIAAARAHLEGQCFREGVLQAAAWIDDMDPSLADFIQSKLPQPPQQREDGLICLTCGMKAKSGTNYCPECFFSLGSSSSAPSSTVADKTDEWDWRNAANPSPDAGLVERLELWSKLGPGEQREVVQAVRSAIEEKDALIERLRGYICKYEDAIKAQDAHKQIDPSPDTNFSERKSEDAGLVDRLRKEASDTYDEVSAPKCLWSEAADALEAKDAEIVDLADRERRWKSAAEYTGQEIVKAQAEIERLKKAYPFHAWAKQKAEANAEIERLNGIIEGLKIDPDLAALVRSALGEKP
jgi:hypothetical protein